MKCRVASRVLPIIWKINNGMKNSYFDISNEGQETALVLRGHWIIAHSDEINHALEKTRTAFSVVDARSVGKMDLWGALKLESLARASNARAILNEEQQRITQFLPMERIELPAEDKSSYFVRLFEVWGKMAVNAGKTMYGMTVFVGEIATVFLKNFAHPRSFRFHSIVRHIEETGLRALPIICLLAVLISMVISYQAATQLQRFGASIFTVDLTVISILREMGVLVTAIMVAGRSGSAFAAEIGVMKLREEVDALKTMGLNPIEVLVIPRLIAMMITLPILAFLADITGLAGGGVIAVLLLDIPIDSYIDRVEMVAKPTMFFVGLIKAPVFAFIITIVGTYQGMNVSGSAESVGKLTTVAVVQSIFLVIMVDALFSIIFSNLGI